MLRKIILIVSMLSLSGCSPGVVLFGGGVAANRIFTEPRRFSSVAYDAIVNRDLSKMLAQDATLNKNSHITATTYNQVILLTGQAPEERLCQKAFSYAKSMPGIKRIFNQLIISQPTSLWQRIQDALLTAMVRTRLLMTSHLHSHCFKIITEDKAVFILGKANYDQAKLAASVAQKTPGVKRVIQIVEYNE